MAKNDDLDAQAEALLLLFREKLQVRATTLEKAVGKAGRRLPRRHRKQMRDLMAARTLSGHPKLAAQIDHAALRKGIKQTAEYLRALDPVAARRDLWLNMTALVAFYVLAVTIVFIWFLWWRGYV